MLNKAPGLKWVLLVGLAGFLAGFIGPIILVPEANQGPLVGIFISGPVGALAGVCLFAFCTALRVSARAQWRLLFASAAVCALVTLFFVLPGPRLLGYLYSAKIESCAPVDSLEEATIARWHKRIGQVAWVSPTAGWERDMRAQIRNAPGVIVAVGELERNSINEYRKPWNHGVRYADGWKALTEATSFYDPEGTCRNYRLGTDFQTFVNYSRATEIKPPDHWPPRELDAVVGLSLTEAIPESLSKYARR